MPEDFFNPFVNNDLLIPKRYLDDVQKYSMTFKDTEKKKDIDRSPFDRYLDIWWAAMAIGVREGEVSRVDEPHKFITGTVFSSNPWMIVHLQMVALAHSGNVEVVRDRSSIISIANGYAATGLPIIIDILSKKLEPIWDISNFFKKYSEIEQTN
jgi:hypothetical protein